MIDGKLNKIDVPFEDISDNNVTIQIDSQNKIYIWAGEIVTEDLEAINMRLVGHKDMVIPSPAEYNSDENTVYAFTYKDATFSFCLAVTETSLNVLKATDTCTSEIIA